jgi:hypothetical protein
VEGNNFGAGQSEPIGDCRSPQGRPTNKLVKGFFSLSSVAGLPTENMKGDNLSATAAFLFFLPCSLIQFIQLTVTRMFGC